jgi:hypothetical protein
MAITFKPEQTMVSAANEKAFVVHRDGELIGWAYFHERNGWRCVSHGRRARMYYWTTKAEVSAWLEKMSPP